MIPLIRPIGAVPHPRGLDGVACSIPDPRPPLPPPNEPPLKATLADLLKAAAEKKKEPKKP